MAVEDAGLGRGERHGDAELGLERFGLGGRDQGDALDVVLLCLRKDRLHGRDLIGLARHD
jgi:hypothetical protein